MADDDIGGADTLAAFIKLLEYGDRSSLNTAFRMALSHQEMASELVYGILSVFEDPKTDMSQWRVLVAFIESLVKRSSDFELATSEAFSELERIFNTAPRFSRSFAHAILSLLSNLSSLTQSKWQSFADSLKTKLEAADHPSSQAFDSKRRQEYLISIESCREQFRIKREECWRLSPCKESSLLRINEMKALLSQQSRNHFDASTNAQRFCHLNQISELPLHAPSFVASRQETCRPCKEQAVIVDFDFLGHQHDKLHRSEIQWLASRFFFYNDLADFEQPHVSYYRADDDLSIDLSHHSWNHDPLSQWIRHRDTSRSRHRNSDGRAHGEDHKGNIKFYRERSMRYRHVVERFSVLAHRYRTSSHYTNVFARECNDTRGKRLIDPLNDDDDDRETERNSRLSSDFKKEQRLVEKLLQLKLFLKECRQKGIKMYVVSQMHLSLLLAAIVYFELDDLIHPKEVYSTAKFGLTWTLEHIVSLREDSISHIFISNDQRSLKIDSLETASSLLEASRTLGL